MKLFRRTKRWLKRAYPLPFPVRVHTLPQSHPRMDGACGWFVVEGEGRYRIYIAIAQDSCMAETLIEEWSHALRHAMPLDVDYDGEPHDAHFWGIYGAITNSWRSRFRSS
jgi:hypothetical protein